MGYYSYVNGGAHITPSIPEKDWPDDWKEAGEGYFVLVDIEGDEDLKVVNGRLTVVGTNPGYTRVDFRWEDNGKFYDISDQMQGLFDWTQRHKSKIVGSFTRTGEEAPDYQRWRFEGDQMLDETPKLVWPNGDVGV